MENTSQLFADLCAVREHLSDNIHRSIQCVLHCRDIFFLIHKLFCVFQRIKALLLFEYFQSKRLQSALFGDRSPRFSLRTERTVNILKLAQGLCFIQRRADFIGHFLLTCDQLSDLFPAFIQSAQIIQLFTEFTDQLIVHRTVHFFTVTGDKRNCVAVIKQIDDILRVFLFDVELF